MLEALQGHRKLTSRYSVCQHSKFCRHASQAVQFLLPGGTAEARLFVQAEPFQSSLLQGSYTLLPVCRIHSELCVELLGLGFARNELECQRQRNLEYSVGVGPLACVHLGLLSSMTIAEFEDH